MSTLAELFDAIPVQAWQQCGAHPQPADPAADVVTDAAAALAHAARLLEHVGGTPLGRGRYASDRARATTALAEECRATAQAMATGVGSAGRLCQLMAGAADQAAVQRPRPNSDERWAITTAALTPIQACAAVLREHAPSPDLIRLAQQIHRVSEHATALPATPAASARLDQVLPRPNRAHHRALDGAVHAVDALSYAAATTDLTAHDARHVTVAALHIALYATHIQQLLAAAGPALTPARDARPAGDQMVKLWFATRDAVRNAVTGRRPPTNVSVGWAAGETVTRLAAAFGPVTAPVIEAAGTPTLVATAYRAMINRLPGLARQIADAAAGWGVPRREPIEADQPISWRDRGGVQRYSSVQSTQLDPNRCLEAATAAHAAATASTAVAAQADRTSMRLGTQPHPHLAAAYIHAAQTTPAPAASRWAEIVEAIDHRLVAGPDWPALAAALDRAAAAGYDLTIHLPRLAAEPLPDRLPASELRYRLINEEPAAGTVLPRGVALVAGAGQDAAVTRTRQATPDPATVASLQPRGGPAPGR